MSKWNILCTVRKVLPPKGYLQSTQNEKNKHHAEPCLTNWPRDRDILKYWALKNSFKVLFWLEKIKFIWEGCQQLAFFYGASYLDFVVNLGITFRLWATEIETTPWWAAYITGSHYLRPEVPEGRRDHTGKGATSTRFLQIPPLPGKRIGHACQSHCLPSSPLPLCGWRLPSAAFAVWRVI